MKIFHFPRKKMCLSAVLGAGLMGIAQSLPAESMRSEEQSGAAQKWPTFFEADKNSDHYVTKDELNAYPDLVKRFDTVDAGKDGRLEEHEYANLVAEKRREKGR